MRKQKKIRNIETKRITYVEAQNQKLPPQLWYDIIIIITINRARSELLLLRGHYIIIVISARVHNIL